MIHLATMNQLKRIIIYVEIALILLNNRHFYQDDPYMIFLDDTIEKGPIFNKM